MLLARAALASLLLVATALPSASASVPVSATESTPGTLRIAFLTDAQESGERLPLREAVGLLERANASLLLYGGDTTYGYGDAPEDWLDALGPYASHDRMRFVYGNHDGGDGYAAFQPVGDARNATWWVEERNGVVVIGLDTNQPLAHDSPQVQWLRATLALHEARVVILMLHMPWWVPNEHHAESVAFRGDPALFSRLVATHRVDLVLAGHEHYHARHVVNGTVFLVGGAIDARTRAVPDAVDRSAAFAGRIPTTVLMDASACGIQGWTLQGTIVVDAFQTFAAAGPFGGETRLHDARCAYGAAIPLAEGSDPAATPATSPAAPGPAGEEAALLSAAATDGDGELDDWIEDGLAIYVALAVTAILVWSVRRRS